MRTPWPSSLMQPTCFQMSVALQCRSLQPSMQPSAAKSTSHTGAPPLLVAKRTRTDACPSFFACCTSVLLATRSSSSWQAKLGLLLSGSA